MTSEKKEILLLIHQFLAEEYMFRTLRMLEKESGVLFSMKHFEYILTHGDWDEVEDYLSRFTNMNENSISSKIFIEIRKQRFLEALDRKDKMEALEILHKYFKPSYNGIKDDFWECMVLLSLDDFRENEKFSGYVDTKSARARLLVELKSLIRKDPLLQDKLQVPIKHKSRLRRLINLSLKRKDQMCNHWKPLEYVHLSQLCSLLLPNEMSAPRIMKLMYTNCGTTLVALSYNASHYQWIWRMDDLPEVAVKASTKEIPKLWYPSSRIGMMNEVVNDPPEEAISCFDISKDDKLVVSVSGGVTSLYNIMTFRTLGISRNPPPAATFVAFHPKDNNLIAIGMDDSTIHVYHVQRDELIVKLQGHQKRVTGLAFVDGPNFLVSSGADSQLCVWTMSRWEMEASRFLEMPVGRDHNSNSYTRVQVNKEQLDVLAVHETQVAVYDFPTLEYVLKWFPPQEPNNDNAIITDATFSCDSKMIFASLKDGRVSVLSSDFLILRCMIHHDAYSRNDPITSYPVAIAAHPSESNQFALGLSCGDVHIVEPHSWDEVWGCDLPGNVYI